MPLRGRARRGVSFLSSKFAVDINQNVAPPSPSGGGEHALRKVSSLSSSCALDLQARSLVKNVKRVGPRRPSRMPLAACATRWFPGRGRLLAGPRSAGTFYSGRLCSPEDIGLGNRRDPPLESPLRGDPAQIRSLPCARNPPRRCLPLSQRRKASPSTPPPTQAVGSRSWSFRTLPFPSVGRALPGFGRRCVGCWRQRFAK